MAIEITLQNRYTFIKGIDRDTARALQKITSYLVAGFMFTPSFRAKRWDGRVHLMSFKPGSGYKLPIGLIQDVLDALDKFGLKYKLLDERDYHGPRIDVGWNKSIKLRPYQESAIKAITSPGVTMGSGLLKMPIRSGKTKTAAGVIRKIKRRTLFIVPSKMLLHQTKESLEDSLCVNVGVIGDSEWIEKDVTVATIQTLVKASGGTKTVKGKQEYVPPTPEYKRLISHYDVVIFDEAHHLRGDKWHEIVMQLDCRHRIGLSATIHLDNDKENERGVIWLKACCGNVRYDISTSHLIEKGYLMRQNVELHKIEHPNGYKDWKWCQELRDALIYENEYRNNMVVELTLAKLKERYKVLIVSNRLNQIKQITDMMDEYHILCESVTGNDNSLERKRKVTAFLDGTVDVLIGTVFGEGVDIPEIECVINAEGGRDIKSAIQRMRNMTPSEGKKKAVFVDFMDYTNPYFAQHSLDRLRTYRSESAFNVRIVD